MGEAGSKVLTAEIKAAGKSVTLQDGCQIWEYPKTTCALRNVQHQAHGTCSSYAVSDAITISLSGLKGMDMHSTQRSFLRDALINMVVNNESCAGPRGHACVKAFSLMQEKSLLSSDYDCIRIKQCHNPKDACDEFTYGPLTVSIHLDGGILHSAPVVNHDDIRDSPKWNDDRYSHRTNESVAHAMVLLAVRVVPGHGNMLYFKNSWGEHGLKAIRDCDVTSFSIFAMAKTQDSGDGTYTKTQKYDYLCGPPRVPARGSAA